MSRAEVPLHIIGRSEGEEFFIHTLKLLDKQEMKNKLKET